MGNVRQAGFYVAIGIVRIAALTWYIGSLRDTLFGGGELVIPPFSIAGRDGTKDAE